MTYQHDDTISEPASSAARAVQGEPVQKGTPISIVSYNIHLAIGRDRRYEPQRILDVLREIDADVIGLQEVQLGAGGFDMLRFLAKGLGFEAAAGPTLAHPERGAYGNAVLSRHPIRAVRPIDLSVRRREPRGALDIELTCPGRSLRVIATHLGLLPAERRTQIKRLLRAFEDDEVMTTVLIGDLNEWFLWGRPLRWLHAYFKETPSPRTFPSGKPLFALDRIWVRPRALLRDVRVHDSRLARIASDHLPLVGVVNP
ncbi:MAG TPA: endonuclease/exonuclease/phosphatase family protein [Burkholderiales bacterium]